MRTTDGRPASGEVTTQSRPDAQCPLTPTTGSALRPSRYLVVVEAGEPDHAGEPTPDGYIPEEVRKCLTWVAGCNDAMAAGGFWDRAGCATRVMSLECPSAVQRVQSVVRVRFRVPSAVMRKLFISYSHKDERWLNRLLVHLRPAERTRQLDLWADTRIKPGEDWSAAIESALAETDIAVLLVSADFLASEFITSKELPPLLRAAKLRACRVLPVIIGPCLFSRIQNLQQFQAINSPGRPLAKMKKAEAEETLAKVAVTILDQQSGERRIRGRRKSQTDVTGQAPIARPVRRKFRGEPQIDGLISKVKLADWDSAEEAALKVITMTGSSGKNHAFESLLRYQNCPDDDDRLWGALHTIECCVHFAPGLVDHAQLSRMGAHRNFSVRSSAASICMDLAHSCPCLVPRFEAISLRRGLVR